MGDPTAWAILDALEVAVFVTDCEGMIRHRNAAAAAMLLQGDDVGAAFDRCRLSPDFQGWAAEIRRIIDQGASRRLDGRLPADGAAEPRLVTLHCTPLIGPGSRGVAGVVIAIRLEPDRETSSERLEMAQRLASLGKLAARVAHELNNPLDGILRYVNLSLRLADSAGGSKLKSYLTESRTGLTRMVQIIGELLEFSRTTEGRFDEAEINELVEQAIRNTMCAAGAVGIVVTEDYQTQNMPSVRGSRLYQVCCNLIKNAIDAMPDGGRLSVTTGLVDQDVVIRVVDTGSGLPVDVDKVFEPFFTTKSAGKGTGLGLAICKDFVEDMQGTITAAAGEDGGAVFTVRIPMASCSRKDASTGVVRLGRRREGR